MVGIPSAAIASLMMYSRKYRTERRAAVASSVRTASGSAPFRWTVAPVAVNVDDFTNENGAAVTKLRNEVAELVDGIRPCAQRLCSRAQCTLPAKIALASGEAGRGRVPSPSSRARAAH